MQYHCCRANRWMWGLFAAATELWLMWAKERWPGNAAEPDIIVEGSAGHVAWDGDGDSDYSDC
jgi:hypothetical protein